MSGNCSPTANPTSNESVTNGNTFQRKENSLFHRDEDGACEVGTTVPTKGLDPHVRQLHYQPVIC